MQLHELRQYIQLSRQNATYGQIGEALGISGAMVKYIETHPDYRPSKRMEMTLHLDPSPDLVYTRTRRDKLNTVAVSWGYGGWCQFETAVITYHEQKTPSQ
jgi:hypothetical protein